VFCTSNAFVATMLSKYVPACSPPNAANVSKADFGHVEGCPTCERDAACPISTG